MQDVYSDKFKNVKVALETPYNHSEIYFANMKGVCIERYDFSLFHNTLHTDLIQALADKAESEALAESTRAHNSKMKRLELQMQQAKDKFESDTKAIKERSNTIRVHAGIAIK